MSGNLESEHGTSATGSAAGSGSGAGKMYPMDLAVPPQKITIVKSAAAPADSKVHLAAPQSKPHLLSHTGPISLVRPAPQIISQGVASQPQMMVSGTPLPPGAQLVNQTSPLLGQPQIIGTSGQLINPQTQIISQTAQLISQSTQLISQGTQLISQGTQIISQGSQLMSQMGPAGQAAGGQVLSVGAPGAGVVVGSGGGLRALPASMRVLPPTTHAAPRPVVSSVTVTPIGGPLGSKQPALAGVTSHVPRGPAAGASLAVPRAAARPATPVPSALPVSTLGGWSGRGGVRGPALVYPARAGPRAPPPRASGPVPNSHSVHSQTPTSTNGVNTATIASGGVSQGLRMSHARAAAPQRASAPPAAAPRASAPHGPPPRVSASHAAQPRPLPVLQRNFQPAKVVSVGARAATAVPVTRSALYYEVTRTNAPAPVTITTQPSTFAYTHSTFVHHHLPAVSMTVVPVSSAGDVSPAPTPPPATPLAASALARPSILRKRDIEGSPSKSVGTSTAAYASCLSDEASIVSVGWSVRRAEPGGIEDGPSARVDEDEGGDGGSTTVSAASSPAPDDDPPSPPRVPTPPTPAPHDISPRKKPRKQMLSSEVRHCEFPSEEPPPPSPPVPALPTPPRRSLLGAGWVCGYRAPALHFNRPSEVRRREPRPPHVLELANQKHVLTKANGWKVHHLTAQMEDLVELESASREQLGAVLRSLDSSSAPHLHAIMELVKGNMQRSKIVCDDMREARADILRVFTHRTLVADILARQADKRCFRKHRTAHS